MTHSWLTRSRLLLGVLLLFIVSACSTQPRTVTHELTVTLAGDGAGTVTSAPEGIQMVSGDDPGVLQVESGTSVTLAAVPAAGSSFAGWSGMCEDQGASCTLTIEEDVEVTATFTLDPVVVTRTLSVDVDGDGTGRVISDDPDDIDTDAGNFTATFEVGTPVTLTADAADGSVFIGWSGDADCTGTEPCTITLDDDTTITATFDLAPPESRSLTVELDGDGTGRVISDDPDDIDTDAGNFTATFEVGTPVTLTADAADGSVFIGWSGDADCTGTEPCIVILDEDTTVTATFDLLFTLDVDVARGGDAADGFVTSDQGDIDTSLGSTSAEFPSNTLVTLMATVTEGAFAGWVGGGCDDVKEPVCVVTMDASKSVFGTFNDVQTQVVRVAAGGDDAVEFLGDSVAGQTWPDDPTPRWFEGWVWAVRPNLHLGWAVYHNLAEAAFRFPAVEVPTGAIVTNATLQVTSAGQEDAFPADKDLSLTIVGELSPNPSGFVQPPADETTFAITTRPRTDASVTWDITGAWPTNSVHVAPDAASILQEIADQPGWASGNAVVLFLRGGSLSDEAYRRIRTFESGDPVDRHPTLIVQYVVKPPVP